MKLETFILTTDLRLHHRGGLGPEGVVEGDGVAEHTAGVPTAAVLLPFTHRQVWRGGRTKVTRGPERLGENGRATKKENTRSSEFMNEKERVRERGERVNARSFTQRKKERKKERKAPVRATECPWASWASNQQPHSFTFISASQRNTKIYNKWKQRQLWVPVYQTL